jgi:hypothetical protein
LGHARLVMAVIGDGSWEISCLSVWQAVVGVWATTVASGSQGSGNGCHHICMVERARLIADLPPHYPGLHTPPVPG